MDREKVDSLVGNMDAGMRAWREAEERRQEAARVEAERADACRERASAVMGRFRDFVTTAAPHDPNELKPDSFHEGRQWIEARDRVARVEVVLGRYDSAELGPGEVVASVAPYGHGVATNAPTRYSELSGAHTYRIGLVFRHISEETELAIDRPLEETEAYSINGILELRDRREPGYIDEMEAMVTQMEADSAETLAVLEAAARDPELNPDLAARFAARAPLPAVEA